MESSSARSQKELEIDPISAEAYCSRANSKINVEDYAPKASIEKALLLHDTNDRVLPVEKSREVAKKWPAATLKEVTGTGHYKILVTKKVVDEILDFLNA